jgi:hypothetical protein
MELGKVFSSLSLEPDVICPDSGIVWTHRKTKDADIYFISNQLDREFSTRLSFRVKDKAPEFWHPDTGDIIECSVFQNANNRSIVPVTLDPSGSKFIVFRKPAHQTSAIEDLKDKEAKIEYIAITEPWMLYFPEGWDAPDSIKVNKLVSWTDFPQAGIKYFSGTVVYQNTFELQEEVLNEGERIFLDLGQVGVMAEVTVNGNNKGVLWKKPYKADITDVVKPGRNRLTVRVTNTWWNRLVGDEKYPEGFPGSDFHSKRTFATVKGWGAENELLESGLNGPVRIILETK